MPNANDVPYSSTAIANTTAYKARIIEVANKLGLRNLSVYQIRHFAWDDYTGVFRRYCR